MDYIQTVLNKYRCPYESSNYLPFSEVLDSSKYNPVRVCFNQIKRVLTYAREIRYEIQMIWHNQEYEGKVKAEMANNQRMAYFEFIGRMNFNPHTTYQLIRAIENPRNKDVSATLFNMLFQYPNASFYKAIVASKKRVPTLVEDTEGDIDIYGVRYKLLRNEQI